MSKKETPYGRRAIDNTSSWNGVSRASSPEISIDVIDIEMRECYYEVSIKAAISESAINSKRYPRRNWSG